MISILILWFFLIQTEYSSLITQQANGFCKKNVYKMSTIDKYWKYSKRQSHQGPDIHLLISCTGYERLLLLGNKVICVFSWRHHLSSLVDGLNRFYFLFPYCKYNIWVWIWVNEIFFACLQDWSFRWNISFLCVACLHGFLEIRTEEDPEISGTVYKCVCVCVCLHEHTGSRLPFLCHNAIGLLRWKTFNKEST